MITEQAVVTRCDGRRVEIRLQRDSACGRCELSQGCGTGAIGRLLGHRSKPLVLESERQLKPGDSLVVGMPESAVVRASLSVYGLPLAGMIAAGLPAALYDLADAWVAIAAFTGLFAGVKLASRLARRLEYDRLTPHIVEVRLNPKS
ncbi:MAG: SoxR reducing system RseC family protein [Gammaproteobacteria bacterium]|nr:SoxR reducing system RseC family protein [Gammaproteobacteria bacterium]MDH3536741.1 SoxR reducing system RseC family protein [Gammaproteobacteria bacterium]